MNWQESTLIDNFKLTVIDDNWQFKIDDFFGSHTLIKSKLIFIFIEFFIYFYPTPSRRCDESRTTWHWIHERRSCRFKKSSILNCQLSSITVNLRLSIIVNFKLSVIIHDCQLLPVSVNLKLSIIPRFCQFKKLSICILFIALYTLPI